MRRPGNSSAPSAPAAGTLRWMTAHGSDAPGHPAPRIGSLPDEATSLEWLSAMLLVRRFEERAGEAYTRAKVGGFLHLSIGEEATVVGAVRAIRATDWLISTYRSHGHALSRGTPPGTVMAELYGKVTGASHGRGGSMHVFDVERRFMGGWGIVGGNVPIGAGFALASSYRGDPEATLCVLGDGATNQGTFGETLNLAALWRLPVVFLVTNNRFGMGTALERHSAVTDLVRKGEGFGVEGRRCDGMDVCDTHSAIADAIELARSEQRPILVEAETYRFRGHSMADPERYRSREQVEQWRRRDPIETFSARLVEAGILTDEARARLDAEAVAKVDSAVEFAEKSPEPSPESLYDDVYALGGEVSPDGWLSTHPPGKGPL